MPRRNKFTYFLFTSLFTLFLLQNCFAATLADWKDAKAYKPCPILFLHGFISNSGSWQTAVNSLYKLYSNYQPIGSYLELIDVQDNTGSVDTYSDGRKGWADVLSERIKQLLDKTKYGSYTTKLNLVSYSMGGLAAREFLTNPKYGSGYVNKLILIGTPNLGTPLLHGPNGLCEVSKLGVMMSPRLFLNFCSFRNNLNDFAKLIFVPNLEILDAVKDMTPGSDFLNKLNNRAQSSNVQYCGIYGIISHRLNRVFFGSLEGGDGIVSEKSQLGTGRITFKELPIKIKAFHTDEPTISVANDNPLLKLLDSIPPEFTLDSPVANSTTEINTNSISIKGKVYKEYLPADSKLIVTGIKQEDGSSLGEFSYDLKPSSLWIPNNPDSPVAEFDETIALLGKGTYKISCQIKNPAGLTSDIKVFWVKVIIQSNANIIVHCHNPEGKEIASIQGVGQQSVEIYDGDALIGYGAYDTNTHNKPISIPSGSHTIKVKFNGMTMSQNINIAGGENQEITFIFKRTSIDVSSLVSMTSAATNTTSQLQKFPTHGAHGIGVSVNPWVDGRYELSNAFAGANFGWFTDYPFFPFTSVAAINIQVSVTPTECTISGDASCEGNAQSGYQGFPLADIGIYLGMKQISEFSLRIDFENWFCQMIEPVYSSASKVLGFSLHSSVQSRVGITPSYPIGSSHNPGVYYNTPVSASTNFRLLGWASNSADWFVGLAGSYNYNIPLAISARETVQISAGTLMISNVPYAVEDLP